MQNPFVPGPGGVLSADIAVPEHAREVAFYSQILTSGESPLWRDDLMNNEGMPVIGLGARIPAYETLPLQWMPHFQVADVGASAARAVELGGKELMHGKDEDSVSQWAVLTDPNGAAFGLIPVVGADAVPGDLTGRIGRIAWLSLVVPDVALACEFYEQVIGWSKAAAATDGAFDMLRPDGGASATIHPAAGANAGLPTAWIISLPVDDLEESLRRAREAGGQVIEASIGEGRIVVRDPVGVCIGLQESA